MLVEASSDSVRPVSAPISVWRFPVWAIAFATVACFLCFLPFWDGLKNLWRGWLTSPESSHGLLIPPIAAFLIWQQRDRLERLNFDGSWWGPVWIIGGALLLALGQLGTVYILVQFGFLMTLCGLLLSLLGWAAFRVISVPLFLLLFMIPLPAIFTYNLSTKLQLVSSQLGVLFIRLFDVSVFLEGNVIDLGGYKLEVAEACSGLRYLLPLMTLGFLMAYFYKGALWKRIVLFLSSIPITVLMNSLRVGIIGVTVDRWGTGMAEGFLHEIQGWMIFMASAALMVAEIAILNVIGREKGTWRQLFGVELPAPTPLGALKRERKLPASFITATVMIGLVVAVAVLVPRPVEAVPARTSLVQFPMILGPWRGRAQSMERVYTDQLQLDDYILADYVNDSGSAVNLYISWYDSQRKGEAVHSPRACLPGGGWQMRDFGPRDLSGVSIDGRPLQVNRALIELGSQRQLVYYWFQQRGRIIDNEFAVKWYLFLDAMTRHRTDGAMVRLITPLSAAASEADADRRLTDVASRIAADLPRYVPD
jgi:exosortase D (VPLPA-CTERM-specific)